MELVTNDLARPACRASDDARREDEGWADEMDAVEKRAAAKGALAARGWRTTESEGLRSERSDIRGCESGDWG